jgi:exodeoxyribonuclease-3
MRLISFNVNGIRSMIGKIKNGEKKGGMADNVIKSLIEEKQPDILCFQEVKTQNQSDIAVCKPYFPYIYTNFSKIKKGYSGVALLSKQEPEWVQDGFDRYSE